MTRMTRLKLLLAAAVFAVSAPAMAECSEYVLEKQFETSFGVTYLADANLVCLDVPTPDPEPDPEFFPTLSVNPAALTGPGDVLVTWDTDGDVCVGSAQGVLDPVELSAGGSLSVQVTGPIEFSLACSEITLLAPVLFTPVDPEPPVDPPVDPEPPVDPPVDPPVPPVDGDYYGVPEVPAFSRQDGINGNWQTLGGTISSLSSGYFTCNGGSVKAQSKNQISLGSNTVVKDCVLNGDRFIGQGDSIAVLDSEINFPPKVGISITGTNIVIRGNSVTGSGAGGSTERHGINNGCGSNGVWVLENRLVGNSGDGFQSGHNCGSNPLRNVYVAGNHAELNRENAYDTKRVVGYVLSENTATGHAAAGKGERWCFEGRCGTFSSGSDGAPIVLGSDGSTDDVVVHGNVLYGNSKGIRVEESDGTRIQSNTVTGASIALELEKDGGKARGLFIEVNDNDFGGGSIRSRFRSQNFCVRGSGNVNYTLDMKNDTLSCSDLDYTP